MLPNEAAQVTVLFEVVPATVAVKGRVPPVVEEAEAGDIVTAVTVWLIGGGEFTVTVAVAELFGPEMLFAVITTVPALDGAV
jgi:hypothetical protein